MKYNLKENYPHLVAFLIFLIVSITYLSPVLNGLSLKQDDIDNHKGVAKEIKDHREEYNEEPLWTNSMFGGMPATQVSVKHDSNLLSYAQKVMSLGLPHPISVLFLYLLGFYILCICLSIKPWLSIVGAIMFGLSSFFFISLSVGHNSKIMAMAFMPMIVGAFIYSYRKKAIVGAILMALFLGLELKSNHLQITYYTFMILIPLGFSELIRVYFAKRIPSFFKTTGLLVIAGLLAVLCNSGNLFMTYDYLPDSQRGPSELTSKTLGGKEKAKTGGLDINYMTNWSYGLGESVNLIIPNAKGGGSGPYLLDENLMENDNESSILKNFVSDAKEKRWYISTYWGNQPSTAGPVYIGATIFILFFLGLFFLKDKIKWPLLIILLISLFLSWGHNWMFLTKLFADFFPGYSKFRSVTMILVIAELILPLIGVLWLFQFIEKQKDFLNNEVDLKFIKIKNLKLFYILSSIVVVFFLSFVVAPDIFLNFISQNEQQIINQLSVMDSQVRELIDFRMRTVSLDALRSLILVTIVLLTIHLFIKNKISKQIFIFSIAITVLFDMWGVSKRYLNNNDHSDLETQYTGKSGLKYWQDYELKFFPHSPKPADLAIRDYEIASNNDLRIEIQNTMREVLNDFEDSDYRNRIANVQSFKALNLNTNYRVLEMGNPLNTARTSFLHKSIGGYSAVKVKRVQELIDFYFQKEYNILNSSLKNNQFDLLKSNHFFNMLNTKYYIFNLDGNSVVDFISPNSNKTPGVLKNPYALGNAWTVKEIKWVPNADAEIAFLNDASFDPSKTAIIDERFRDLIGDISTSGKSDVKLLNYRANRLEYQIDAQSEELIVFSEVFYNKGWKAFVDGIETPHVRVNYVLRGLKVDSGIHKILFKYDLPIFNYASIISLSSSIIVLLLFLLMLFFKLKERQFPEI
ncbi:MAG: YfhO family protein [Flavobacteriales bacterium]